MPWTQNGTWFPTSRKEWELAWLSPKHMLRAQNALGWTPPSVFKLPYWFLGYSIKGRTAERPSRRTEEERVLSLAGRYWQSTGKYSSSMHITTWPGSHCIALSGGRESVTSLLHLSSYAGKWGGNAMHAEAQFLWFHAFLPIEPLGPPCVFPTNFFQFLKKTEQPVTSGCSHQPALLTQFLL